MPRLLLVDDNPSIHKIAETLLAHSDISLVCAESAAQALDLVSHGEPFDVALIDIAMQPMDGWTLLEQFRTHPATASLPIALMAGVLDQVDPARIEQAPIQGFLKKPVELRDLVDRVQSLLKAAPAAPSAAPNPFATLPGARLADLPEYRPSEPEAPAIENGEDLQLDLEDLDPGAPSSDVLELGEEDLWPEPEAKVAPKGPDVVHAPRPGTVTEELDATLEITDEPALDLEAFDLDSLKSLTPPVEAASGPAEVQPQTAPLDATPDLDETPDLDLADLLASPALSAPMPAPAIHEIPLPEPPSDLDLDQLLAAPMAETPLSHSAPEPPEPTEAPAPQDELPDLGGDDAPTFDPEALSRLDDLPEAPSPAPEPFALPDPFEDLAPAPVAPLSPEPEAESEPLDLGPTLTLEPEPEADLPSPEPAEILEPLPVQPPVPSPEAAPMVPMPIAEPGTPGDARALVKALAADPEALDALARAVVARLGEQTLREVAWEILPDLAERMHNRP